MVSEDNRKGKKPPPAIFDLNSDSGIQRFQAALAQSDDDGDSPFERFEVTWPFPMLEVGFFKANTKLSADIYLYFLVINLSSLAFVLS